MNDVKSDWVIEPGDPKGEKFGFTSEKFMGYISEEDHILWISAIISTQPGKGNFSSLVKLALNQGYIVKIPSPFPRMQAIAKHLKFKRTFEIFPEMDEEIEVWVKNPRGFGQSRP
jgi:hypothetical protein